MEKHLKNDLLFDSKLPIVQTEEELEQVKNKYPDYDPCYIASACNERRRELLESLWQQFQPYADSKFLNEIKKSFYQSTWEMYLCYVLLKKKLSLSSKDKGPDFVVNDNLYIECIAPTKGNEPNTVPDLVYGGECASPLPTDQILLRITNAIETKSNKYIEWCDKKTVSKDIPYIIAINTGGLGYPEVSNMPDVLKVLFGFYHQYIEFDSQCTEYRDSGWTFRESVPKKSKSGPDVPVSVNVFLSSVLKHVSGVLFSNTTVVLEHLPDISIDCALVNNPFAAIPLDNWTLNLFPGWLATQSSDLSISLVRHKQ